MKAGLAYGALTFAAGFLFGVLRVTLIAPRLGETAAILIELPLMLAIAWILCGAIIRHLVVAATPQSRAIMGELALVTLIVLEAAMTLTLFGRSLDEFVADYERPGPQLGLLAQALAATYPLLMLYRPRLLGKGVSARPDASPPSRSKPGNADHRAKDPSRDRS
ncbi:MAG: hypothetical protein HXY22_00120 [Alphaproteobacteria bacterium]|nr:hypothetical protein [Alphaproteobacteria bacterium]